MEQLRALLEGKVLSASPPGSARDALVQILAKVSGMHIYPESITASRGRVFFLGRRERSKWLGILFEDAPPDEVQFAGTAREVQLGLPITLQICPTSPENAASLRRALPFTAPKLLGTHKSAGCGDRLGLATPGHVRALRRCLAASRSPGSVIAPIFAQQSIREMVRTERTPQQVMDDASWGVFEEGWQQGFGADADHLKSADDVDLCAQAGYTLFTIDPGDHVDNAATTDSTTALTGRVASLPWDTLESSPAEMRSAYLNRAFNLGDGVVVHFSEESLMRAAAKYGRAVAHTVTLYRHLIRRLGEPGTGFELEVSVDETATPTTPEEHYFVARELIRLGVHWVSLAPRYIGRFEKGVDYIGDLDVFEADLVRHVAIARSLGPYKLSIHSGSDKFSIYPVIARVAGDLVHLKTAGTSYLEALRALAAIEPDLFREILGFAIGRYAEDKATYHVSADPRRFPDPHRLVDDELAEVLDAFDGRQLLHVTFGSVLTTRGDGGGYLFRDRLLEALAGHEESHYATLETHIGRHLAPFAG